MYLIRVRNAIIGLATSMWFINLKSAVSSRAFWRTDKGRLGFTSFYPTIATPTTSIGWVYDYNNQLKAFALNAGSYQELNLTSPKIWMPQLELGLGLWSGEYEGINRKWLRWYDAQGDWILTPSERAEVERQRAETERQRADAQQRRSQRLEELLRSQGIDPDQIT